MTGMQISAFSAQDIALLDLLAWLDAAGYDFVTPTPATHARVLRRGGLAVPRDARDVLGWSLAFAADDAPPDLVTLLDAAGALEFCDQGLHSTIRVSRLHGRLFIHSAYPTEAEDAVFFGPDSYRFADFVARRIGDGQGGRIVDLGGGCGVGAIVAAGLAPQAAVTVADVNPLALRFARINAAHAGLAIEVCETDGLTGLAPGIAVVLANPPYMAGASQTYRDGGEMHGGRLSLDWAEAALDKLAPGGRLLLYTGAAIARGGRDPLRDALTRLAQARGAEIDYRELDPDVFGEELETPAYAEVERIAVVTCEMSL